MAVDLDAHEGFQAAFAGGARSSNGNQFSLGVAHHAQHGVDQEMQREPLAVHFHRHRIDEERHVVVDDLDRGVGALPAVLPGHRVVSTNLGLARGELPGKGKVGRRRALEVGRRAGRELLGVDLGVVKAREFLDQDGVLLVVLRSHGVNSTCA